MGAPVNTQQTDTRAEHPSTMAAAPPEVESTLQRLASHRSVKGVLILATDTGRVIRYSGPMLEEANAPATTATAVPAAGGPANGDESFHRTRDEASHGDEMTSEGGAAGMTTNAAVKKYADAVRKIVNNSKEAVLGLDGEDAVRFLRLRTKKYELMITPEDKYILVVFHDPSPA